MDRDILKVLFATAPMEPPWRDASRRLAHILATHAQGFRPTVLTAGHMLDYNVAKSEDIYRSVDFGIGAKARLFFRLFKPDSNHIVHFFFQSNRRTCRMIRLAMGMRGHDPTIHTHCAAPAEGEEGSLFADVNVAVSHWTRDRLAQATGKDIRMIHPAVEPYEPENHEARETLRGKMGWKDDDIVWIYPGDVEHSSAAHKLLEAFPAQAGQLRLALPCRIKTAETPTCVTELKSLADQAGLTHKIDFLENVDDLPALLHAGDGMLLPVETLYAKMDVPLALLEAMTAGRPVIVSDLPPLLEAIEDSVNGLVVKDATDAWEKALSLTDPADREKLGEAARTTVLDKFSPTRLARDYLELYKDVDY